MQNTLAILVSREADGHSFCSAFAVCRPRDQFYHLLRKIGVVFCSVDAF